MVPIYLLGCECVGVTIVCVRMCRGVYVCVQGGADIAARGCVCLHVGADIAARIVKLM